MNNNVQYSIKKLMVTLVMESDLKFESIDTNPKCQNFKNNQIIWIVLNKKFHF